MKQNFIGFATSSEFLKSINKEEPVNMAVSKKNGKTDKRYGISIDSVCLDVSQVKGTEVFYFHWRIYRYQAMKGNPFGYEDKPAKYGEQAETIVRQWLEDNGIKFRHAMVSMPSSYTMFEGLAEFVGFEKENDSFIYKKETS